MSVRCVGLLAGRLVYEFPKSGGSVHRYNGAFVYMHICTLHIKEPRINRRTWIEISLSSRQEKAPDFIFNQQLSIPNCLLPYHSSHLYSQISLIHIHSYILVACFSLRLTCQPLVSATTPRIASC